MTELVIGFDTSGSIFGGNEMTRFVSEIKTIIEDVKPSKVHVVYCDSEVAGVQTFEDGQFAVQDLKIKGGGGTDLTRIFDWVQSERKTPQAMVILTDGYTPFGNAPEYPVLWAMSTDVVAPFGTTISIKD
jgi:predicted metal-dependent peptidase